MELETIHNATLSRPEIFQPSTPRKKKNQPIDRCASPKEAPLDLSKIHRCDVLATKPKTAVDILRKRFPISSQGRPPFGLKRWIRLPLNSSLLPFPNVKQSQALCYSRGHIGSALIQRQIPNFTLHNERILQSPYSPLHDPGCFNYFMMPMVRKMLEDRNLINKSGKVICSLSEIQQFHDYLVEISNSCINQFLMEKNCRDLYESEQRKILLSPRKTLETEIKTKKKRGSKNKPATPVIVEKLRDLAFQKKKEWEKVTRMEKGLERDMRIQLAVLKCQEQELERRRELLLEQTMKDIGAYMRRENNALVLEEEKQLKNFEWVDAKVRSASERNAREDAIMTAVAEDRKQNAIIRQMAVERCREKNLSKREGSRSTAEYLYLWSLVRKYFDIWLYKTKERITRRKMMDDNHASFFIGRVGIPDPIAQTVAVFVQDLKDDDRPMTNFVMNIMKLRSHFKSSSSLLKFPTRSFAMSESTDTVDEKSDMKISL